MKRIFLTLFVEDEGWRLIVSQGSGVGALSPVVFPSKMCIKLAFKQLTE